MIALLRYAILKGAREKLVVSLLLSPAMMLMAPLLGVTGRYLVRGVSTYPLVLDANMSSAASAGVLGEAGALICSLIAGLGAFWVLRKELADRSIGSFVLAIRPIAIATATTIFGVVSGLAAFALVIGVVWVSTLQLPPQGWPLLAVVIVSSIVCAAVGSAASAFSTDLTMLVPLYATCAIPLLLVKSRAAGFVFALVAAPFLVIAAAYLLRRRCAA